MFLRVLCVRTLSPLLSQSPFFLGGVCVQYKDTNEVEYVAATRLKNVWPHRLPKVSIHRGCEKPFNIICQLLSPGPSSGDILENFAPRKSSTPPPPPQLMKFSNTYLRMF
eukprot:GHVS01082185.1.p3 GENE.GHVS01082185.1~~GHVS01082185.1.p3  ORF type:complete len:110 (-),score=22.35 GHVS01082185.1:591-920(-)